jgi:hypothetical protein
MQIKRNYSVKECLYRAGSVRRGMIPQMSGGFNDNPRSSLQTALVARS